MAGGMNKRGSYGSMAERVRGRSAPDLGADDRPAAEPPSVKHCWVTDHHGRLPGLLLAWEQRAGGWHGRVVRPVREGDDWIVVEEWLPAAYLEQA